MKRFGCFGLDIANQCLWRDGELLAVQPKPFSVLRYLVEHCGRLITHDELLDALWPETWVQPQVLRTYMLELRKMLGDDARQPRFIQSVPKRGYRFIATVSESDGAANTESQGLPNRARAPHLAGRAEEMKQLTACFERARDGERQTVFVTGDSGIGKSALVDEFCRSFDPSVAATVARGACVQGLARKEDYYPMMEALAQLCASPHGEQASAALSKWAPRWLAATGGEGTRGSGAGESRLSGDLCVALEELAKERPLILIFEDLHWGDDASLELISALARRRASTRLLLVAVLNANRPETPQALKRLRQDLTLRRLATEIALAPLDKAAVQAMLVSLLGQESLRENRLPGELAHFVYRRSEGNPLFVVVLVEHLIANETLVRVQSDGGWKWEQRAPIEEIETSIPGELAQMIELEIQGLPLKEQRLLEAASLFPIVFPAWGVAAALEQDLADTEEACDAAATGLSFVHRAGYDELPEGGQSAFYVFTHSLYREVLYERQASSRRAQRHGLVADRLAALFHGREVHVAAEIALHYQAAGNWMGAIKALQAAGHAARARQAHAGATELLNEALRITAHLEEPLRGTIEPQLRSEIGGGSRPSRKALGTVAGARQPAQKV
jgi:DNA-binding winged helix-turn-helix (wHTH) protein